MGNVIVHATMSLDGYVADDADGVSEIFGWYENGDERVASAKPSLDFHLTPEDAAYWREFTSTLGVLVVGRRLFDLTDGWSGAHPLGAPVVVLTHERPDEWVERFPDAQFTFVTEGGVEAAIAAARPLAGERDIAVAAGHVGSQVLAAGFADRVCVDLVPVMLGSGKPFFAAKDAAPVRFGEPRIVPGRGAVHLVYDIQPTGLGQFSR